MGYPVAEDGSSGVLPQAAGPQLFLFQGQGWAPSCGSPESPAKGGHQTSLFEVETTYSSPCTPEAQDSPLSALDSPGSDVATGAELVAEHAELANWEVLGPTTDRGTAVPTCPRAVPKEIGMNLEPFVELDKLLEQSTSSGEVPGLAYAVLKDGKLVKASAFGVADVETKQPWRFDTMCRLYSMTKNVTVCGLMGLVEDGLVYLDDPVAKFLPAFALDRLQVVPDDTLVSSPQAEAPRSPITVKHLLTHTAGLSYGAACGDEPTCATEEAYQPLIRGVDRGEFRDLEAWCDTLATVQLRLQPGTRWEYSYSIDVVGRIIEVASGRRLDDFLQERVLEPLGMHDTTFALPEAKRGRLATFYRRREAPSLEQGAELQQILYAMDRPASSAWVEPLQNRVLSAGGTVGSVAGGLVSTLNDFARFCLMIQNDGELDGVRLLKPETVRLMSQNLLPEVTGQRDCWCLETPGLGFGILGSVAVQHADAKWYDIPGEIGWGGLAGTAWAVDQREGLVVVCFCQVMYELWIDEEVRKATRLALGYREATPALPTSTPVLEIIAEQQSLQHASGLVDVELADATAVLPSGGIPASPEPAAVAVEGEQEGEANISPEPKGVLKRVPEGPADAGHETPKKLRLSSEALMSLGSTEKLKAHDCGLAPLTCANPHVCRQILS